MRLLKQSTARTILVFMTDSSDHVTGKTGLTLTITASKSGAAFASVAPTVTERGSGWYALDLTTTHTNTLGDLALHVTGTGADPTDVLMQVAVVDSNTVQVNGVAAGTSDGTATAGGASTITLATGVTFGTNLLKGRTVTLVGGTGAGQSRYVVSNTNATPSVLTVHRAWDTQPSTDTTYVIDETAEVDAVALSGDTTAADNAESFFDGTGYAGTNNVIPLVTLTTTAANVTTVNGLAANVITAASVANGALDAATFADDVGALFLSYVVDDATRIDASQLNTHTAITAAGVASAVRTNLTTELGRIDVATSTRQATFTAATGVVFPTRFASMLISAAGLVSVDVVAINATDLTGDGTANTPWGPA